MPLTGRARSGAGRRRRARSSRLGAAPALTSPARSPRPSATGRRHAPAVVAGGPPPANAAGPTRSSWPRGATGWPAACARAARSRRLSSTPAPTRARRSTTSPTRSGAVARSRRRSATTPAARTPPVGLAAPVVATCAELGGPAAARARTCRGHAARPRRRARRAPDGERAGPAVGPGADGAPARRSWRCSSSPNRRSAPRWPHRPARAASSPARPSTSADGGGCTG